MIEITLPSGNFMTIDVDTGDTIEFEVESYGHGLIDLEDPNRQQQGRITCDRPRHFQAINASSVDMKIRINT